MDTVAPVLDNLLTQLTAAGVDEQLAKTVIVAHRLAYQAAKPVGLGVLHYRTDATDDEVDAALLCLTSEYRPRPMLTSDYVLGRQVKFTVEFAPDGRLITRPPLPDYQSWSLTYPSYDALFAAAREQLPPPTPAEDVL